MICVAAGAGELYKAIVTILIESFALFFISFLLFLGTWATRSFIQYTFLQILAQTEVRAVINSLDVPQSRYLIV